MKDIDAVTSCLEHLISVLDLDDAFLGSTHGDSYVKLVIWELKSYFLLLFKSFPDYAILRELTEAHLSQGLSW